MVQIHEVLQVVHVERGSLPDALSTFSSSRTDVLRQGHDLDLKNLIPARLFGWRIHPMDYSNSVSRELFAQTVVAFYDRD